MQEQGQHSKLLAWESRCSRTGSSSRNSEGSKGGSSIMGWRAGWGRRAALLCWQQA